MNKRSETPQPWRAISDPEMAMFSALLSVDFPMGGVLQSQLERAQIRHWECSHGGVCGNYFFLVDGCSGYGWGPPATEAHWTSAAGGGFDFLLLLKEDRLAQLEVVNYLDAPLDAFPPGDELDLWSPYSTASST